MRLRTLYTAVEFARETEPLFVSAHWERKQARRLNSIARSLISQDLLLVGIKDKKQL